MKILNTYKDGKLTLFFKGEVDHHSAKAARADIEDLLDEYLPRDCAIELSGVTFMDSSGIAVILRIYKRMNDIGGRAWIENVPPQALRVIDASGIDRIVRVTTTVKE